MFLIKVPILSKGFISITVNKETAQLSTNTLRKLKSILPQGFYKLIFQDQL